jgi:NAD(P)-dependent dehydrogenase (short-subunit alcohol dehydrogenase family)
MDLRLSRKTAALTGASKGIGRATAEAFAAEGCDLVLGARDGLELEKVAAAIESEHKVEVRCCAVDLSKPEDQQRFLQAAGDVDILVNCAGSNPAGRISDVTEEVWRKSWDLKVFGYINLTRSFYEMMRKRGCGVIVNIIGNSAERMNDRYILGSSGNLALVGLTKALGSASPDDGIRVVGVHPGLTATGRIDDLLRGWSTQKYGTPDRAQEVMTEMDLPFGRAGKASEIADAVVFLASPRAAYISGTVLTVDGGAACRHAS